nr:extracellular solute-binding protein [uncultured Sphaerochaeta sp.]
MSRPTTKHVIIILLTIFSMIALLGCQKSETNDSKSSSKKLYVYNWSYYTPDSVIASFEEEFGVDVILDYFASNEEMFTKLMASSGAGYDVIFPSGDYVSIMKNLDMLEKIDTTKMDNLQYISPLALEKATYDPEMEYSVPYYLGASGIAVNKEMVSDYEKSWNIFADERYKDRMVMMDDMREVIGDALAYLGYSVNTTNPAELEEARRLINTEWKPNLVKFDAEGFAKGFASGEYWIAHGYAEAIFEELQESQWDNVDFFLPSDGGPMYIDSMCIPKGARNYDLALEFINYIHKPENYAQFLDRFHFPSSVNMEAEQYRTTTPFYTVDMLTSYELKDDLGASLEMYNKAWESIRYVD